ncbi:hypothetical protein KCP74_05695 [Salmonella enterica subsp. enterica]|nr:hypothetical protein KCP74_05695 [Salmonella enterica subsp. enterica]
MRRSAWRCCCPFTRCGAWRAATRMMASAGVRTAAVYLRGGRVFVLVHAFVVNDFTVALCHRRTLNTQLPVWWWPPLGGRTLLFCGCC